MFTVSMAQTEAKTITYLKCGDVAKICQVTRRTVYNWVVKHDMPCHSTPGGHLRFSPIDLRNWFYEKDMPIPHALKEVSE